jgi:TM2 domain-containing membrane protein YozV
MLKNQKGVTGWILLWLIGIPIPVLLAFFLLRGCT